jgi:Terpene cyclase DEP1
MVRLYAALCMVGAAVPLYFFGSFVADEGLDIAACWDQLTASGISLFAWADVVVSALAIIAFAVRERTRGLTTWWIAALATVLVGPSLGLPLLLLLRERSRAGSEGR